MNVTHKQKELLLQWMKLHPEIARGRLPKKGRSRREMEELLEDMARTINQARYGPVKTGAKWLKTWKDWKANILKKEMKQRNFNSETGGGSPVNISYSSLEEELLKFLNPEAAGLENIPQGGIYSNEDMKNMENIENIENIEDTENTENIENIEDTEESSNHTQKMYKVYFTRSNKSMKKKQLYTNNQFSKAEIESNVQSSSSTNIKKQIAESIKESLSVQMVKIQQEKLKLKKEELIIQRQLLEVQRSMLIELQKIRSTVDTYGHLGEDTL